MQKAKTEQYYLRNQDGTVLKLFRESDSLTDVAFVVAEGVDDTTDDLSSYDKGIYTSIYSKEHNITGKLSLEVYIFGDKKRDEVINYLYRNLDIIRVFKKKLWYGQTTEAYCYCRITKDSISRVKQTNEFKGNIEFDKFTEWFVEDTTIITGEKGEAEIGIGFNTEFDTLQFGMMELRKGIDLNANTSKGNLAPFFRLMLLDKGIAPRITLRQLGRTQVIEFPDLIMRNGDSLIVENILTVPNGMGMKHLLNGKDYFGHHTLQNAPIYSDISGIETLDDFDNTEYVSFFNSLDLSYKLKIDNILRANITIVHRYIKW